MILLLVIGMILVLILGTTGALTPWFSILVLAAGSWVLFLQYRQIHTVKMVLNARKGELGAEAGLAVRHLGGLRLPPEAQVYVYFWQDHLLIESDAFSLELSREDQPFLMLLSKDNHERVLEQIQLPADDPAGLRVLSELKERIRRKDRSIRVNRIILMIYRQAHQDPVSAVFLANGRKKAILRIMASFQLEANEALAKPNETIP